MTTKIEKAVINTEALKTSIVASAKKAHVAVTPEEVASATKIEKVPKVEKEPKKVKTLPEGYAKVKIGDLKVGDKYMYLGDEVVEKVKEIIKLPIEKNAKKGDTRQWYRLITTLPDGSDYPYSPRLATAEITIKYVK